MKKLIKKLITKYRAKQKAKYQRMNSEILCAIIRQVDLDAKLSKGVNIPSFLEVDDRYNSLGIKTPKRLKEVYKNFFQQGLVSGIEL